MDIPGPTVRIDAGMRGGTGSASIRLRPRPTGGHVAPQRTARDRAASQPLPGGRAACQRPTGGRAATQKLIVGRAGRRRLALDPGATT
jgi:hypothetical protein